MSVNVTLTPSQTATASVDTSNVHFASSSYSDLTDKPQVNSVELSGNKTSAQLGVAAASHTHTTADITDYPEQVITKISAGTGIVTSTSGGQAEIGLSSETQASLALADTALQEHQSLSAYRTSAAQDVIDEGKISDPATKTTGQVLTYDGSGWTAQTPSGGTDAGAVHYTADSGKTDAQKETAHRNISIIKTAMDSVAVAGAQYFLGTQTAVSITMPTDALVGQEILVVFTSGSTACTLTCDLTGFSFVPSANKTSWIKFTLHHKADTSVSGDEDEWIVETKEG